jgi:hypothetical protein
MAMNGETDLRTLLAAMEPCLHESPYVFCSLDADAYGQLSFEPLGVFREQEGISIIAMEEQAREHRLAFECRWARITLTVRSSLQAVGFLAAVSAALAGAGISVNPVSGFYHDHLFVPWERRRQAMAALRALSRGR